METAPVEFVWRTTGGPEPLSFTSVLAIDPEGNLWVTDCGANRFQIFAPDGTFLQAIGSSGMSAGQFNRPAAVAIDDAGRIYVTASENARVQVFSTDGQFIAQWDGSVAGATPFQNVVGIALDGNGHISVYDFGDDYEAVQKFRLLESRSQTGPVEFLWESADGPDAPLVNPTTSRVAPDGSVWVIELGNDRFRVYEPDGTFRETWGERGSRPGQFAFTSGENLDGWFTLAADGSVYVVDIDRGLVTKFRLLPPLA